MKQLTHWHLGLALISFHLVVVPCSLAKGAAEGAISSGGGNGVFLKSGGLRFLDMVPNEQLTALDLPGRRLGNALKTQRCLANPMTLIATDNNLLASTWDLLRAHDFPLGVALELATRRILERTYEVEFDLRPVGAFTDSARVHPQYQVPIGGYGGSFLLLQKRLFNMLTLRDRAAFFVHESIREYVTTFAVPSISINLPDLERATRLIIDSPDAPEISTLLKSRQLLGEVRFPGVFRDGVASSRGDSNGGVSHGGDGGDGGDRGVWLSPGVAISNLDKATPNSSVEATELLVQSMMSVQAIKWELNKHPNGNRAAARQVELDQLNQSVLALLKTLYRPGVDPEFQLKMLELDKSFFQGPSQSPKLTFDTHDILWRPEQDPVCFRSGGER